jgi:hypothetical protein
LPAKHQDAALTFTTDKAKAKFAGSAGMENQLLVDLGKIAGIGGLSLGVFLLLFQGMLKKDILPKSGLEPRQAYRIILTAMVLTFGIAAIGIGAWVYSLTFRGNDGPGPPPGRASEKTDRQLLLNIVQASYGEPLKFTAAEQSPINTQTISYYLREQERISPRVLLTLLVSQIEDGNEKFYNDTELKDGNPNYPAFAKELDYLIDHGLTVQPISETRVLGPPLSAKEAQKKDIAALDAQGIAIVQRGEVYYLEKNDVIYQFCFNATPSNLTNTCLAKPAPIPRQSNLPDVSNSRAKARAHDLVLAGRKLVVWVRSTEEVIRYLGAWARNELFPSAGGPTTPPRIFNEYSRCPDAKEDILFDLKRGTAHERAISTSYDGEEYYIGLDPEGCDRSSQVIQVLLKLVGLYDSRKDPPGDPGPTR